MQTLFSECKFDIELQKKSFHVSMKTFGSSSSQQEEPFKTE